MVGRAQVRASRTCETGVLNTKGIDTADSFGSPPATPQPLTELHTGHTIEVSSDRTQTLLAGTDRYKCAQFHFHMKFEHIVGRRSPLEIHFVLGSADKSIAVVGVLVKARAASGAFGRLIASLPKAKGDSVLVKSKVNPVDLMPASRRAWRYSGSLPTPCTEGLRWHVLASQITASRAQLATLRSIVNGNLRPLQARNGRKPT